MIRRALSSGAASSVGSFSEWGVLKDVIVGRCEGSAIPRNEPAFCAKVPKSKEIFHTEGPRPEEAIARGVEELDQLS